MNRCAIDGRHPEHAGVCMRDLLNHDLDNLDMGGHCADRSAFHSASAACSGGGHSS